MDKLNIYKALDHLHFTPENPIWEDIIKDGRMIGVKLINPVIIPQYSFVMAVSENNPFRTSYLMVFGKYPCYPFLLEKVGCLIVKKNKHE